MADHPHNHQQQADAQWDPAANAYATRIRIPPLAPLTPPPLASDNISHVRQKSPVSRSALKVAEEGDACVSNGTMESAAASLGGSFAEVVSPPMISSGCGRTVTIRVQGQGGAPDTLVTIDLP